jgi:predicted nucleic acid-binding protein
MPYLLDTNVLSELRRPRPAPQVVGWLATVPESELYVSVVTLGEIEKGAECLRRRDPARARAIHEWCSALRHHFASRILGVDAETAAHWGRLSGRAPTPPANDAWLAATALAHGLTLATMNGRDFNGLGISLINPAGPADEPIFPVSGKITAKH